MSRIVEQHLEARTQKLRDQVQEAVFGGLEAAVSRGGGELTGFSVKLRGGEVLIVLKARFPGGPQVGFVGGEDWPAALVKAMKQARRDEIRWKQDQWATK